MGSHGPEELFRARCFGVIILCDWETLSVPVYWVDTSFSCQEHSFSDKAPKQTSFDEKSHWGSLRHGFEDLQWIYHVLPVFEKFVMLETFGNVDIPGLDIESSGLNSVILRLRRVQLPFPYFDIWTSSTTFCMILMTDVLKTQICATCTGCLHPGTGVVIAMIRRTSLESYINKTIRPTWATSRLLLSCVSAWLLRSPQ